MQRKRFQRKRQLKKLGQPYFTEQDSWNMSYILARYIAAGLKEFVKANVNSYPGELSEEQGTKEGKKLIAESESKDPMTVWHELIQKMIWSFEEIESDYERNDPHWKWWQENVKDSDVVLNHKSKQLVFKKEVPEEVWEAERKYHKKIQEGLDLFSKYFQSLWD